MRYLRRLTAHEPNGAGDISSIERDDISYDHVRAALIDVIEAATTEAVLLLELEDAHWLDAQSIRLAQDIGTWVTSHRVLFLLTSRTVVIAGEAIVPIWLHPLRKNDSELVAHAIKGQRVTVSENYRSWCVSSCGGNPYYLIELLRNDAIQGDQFEAPASLARLLHGRVMTLTSEARSLLEVCCVLGIHSTMERIEKSIDFSRSTILRALEELDACGMIQIDGPRVLSRHDLLSAVVLSHMSEAVRLLLHRYVATQFEAEADATHSTRLIWESAEHWLSASDAPRAIQLLRRCGNHLTDVGMPEEAARVLERAASLATEPSEKYSIGTERARALMRAERTVDAVAVIDDLLPLRCSIRPTPSPLDEAGVMSLQARWQNCGALPELLREGLAAFALPVTSSKERISAARWLLTAADNICDATLAQQVYDGIFDDLKSERVPTDARLWLQMVYNCNVGDRYLALELANELATYSRHSVSPIVAISHIRHASYVHLCHGQPDRALSLITESFQIGDRLGASRAIAINASVAGSYFMHVGDERSADKWLNCAANSYPRHDGTILGANLLSIRAELAMRKGDLIGASTTLGMCNSVAMGSQSARSSARAVALETHLAIASGRTITEEELQAFRCVFDITRLATCQDYTVEILTLALQSRGCRSEARQLAMDFIHRDRRDLGAVSTSLSAVVSKLSATNETAS
jgi:hypothetical protein